MFEQSILINDSEGRKTRAFAASLSVQILGLAVLVALPLLYNERLPQVRLSIPLALQFHPLRDPPVHQNTAPSTSSGLHTTAVAPRVYAPTHVSTLHAMPTEVGMIEAPALSSSEYVGVPGGIIGSMPILGTLFKEPVSKPSPVAPPSVPSKPVPIGGDVQAAKLLKRVMPTYPALAKQARVSGTVRLIGIIAKDGTIQQLQVASGHPLLVSAAVEAVRQWIYRPTLLNGQPVEVIAPIDVIFTLSN